MPLLRLVFFDGVISARLKVMGGGAFILTRFPHPCEGTVVPRRGLDKGGAGFSVLTLPPHPLFPLQPAVCTCCFFVCGKPTSNQL